MMNLRCPRLGCGATGLQSPSHRETFKDARLLKNRREMEERNFRRRQSQPRISQHGGGGRKRGVGTSCTHAAASSLGPRLIKRARHAAKSAAQRLIFYANRVVKHPRRAAPAIVRESYQKCYDPISLTLRTSTLTPRAEGACLARKRDVEVP